MTRQDKSNQVERLRTEFAALDNMVLLDFRGLNVQAVSQIRRTVREAKGRYEVVQNRLVARALEGTSLEALRDRLSGPTAIAYSRENPLALLKVLQAAAKQHPKFEFKAGVVEGRVVTLAELVAYASLPGKPELIGKLASVLQAPLARLANVLAAPLRSLAGVLDQLAKQKD
jgi:large subunit ribosomal protein L10